MTTGANVSSNNTNGLSLPQTGILPISLFLSIILNFHNLTLPGLPYYYEHSMNHFILNLIKIYLMAYSFIKTSESIVNFIAKDQFSILIKIPKL